MLTFWLRKALFKSKTLIRPMLHVASYKQNKANKYPQVIALYRIHNSVSVKQWKIYNSKSCFLLLRNLFGGPEQYDGLIGSHPVMLCTVELVGAPHVLIILEVLSPDSFYLRIILQALYPCVVGCLKYTKRKFWSWESVF